MISYDICYLSFSDLLSMTISRSIPVAANGIISFFYDWVNSAFKKLRSWHFVPSDQISRSVVSDSLKPHESQHARPPCPSPSPRVCSNSCPSSQWCHPTLSPSVVPFSSCLQFFPSSGLFQFFASRSFIKFQLQHQSFQWIFRTNLL